MANKFSPYWYKQSEKGGETGALRLHKVNEVKKILMRLLIYLTQSGNETSSVIISHLHISQGNELAVSLFLILLSFAQFSLAFVLLFCVSFVTEAFKM